MYDRIKMRNEMIQFLSIKPKHIYCPFCGEWHKWEGEELRTYTQQNPYEYTCHDCDCAIYYDKYEDFEFWICVNLPKSCRTRVYPWKSSLSSINYKVEIPKYLGLNKIEYEEGIPIIRFPFEIEIRNYINKEGYCQCQYRNSCDLIRKWKNKDFEDVKEHIEIYEDSEDDIPMDKKVDYYVKLEFKLEFDKDDIDALKSKNNQAKQNNATGKKKIRKAEEKSIVNEFNENIEMGLNNDNNIANTEMGISVKKGSCWRIFNMAENTINEVRNIQIEKFPIFILPTTELVKGDLIKFNGEYYYVTNVSDEDIDVIHAKSGKMKKIISKFKCYSKAIALNASQNAQLNQLVMFFILKEELGEKNDDMMKMLLEMLISKK